MSGSAMFVVILWLAAGGAFFACSFIRRRRRTVMGTSACDCIGAQEATARATAAAAAVRAMDQLRSELEIADIEIVKSVTARWICFYRRRLAGQSGSLEERSQDGELGRFLRAVAVEAERNTIEDLLAIEAIRPEVARKLIGEIEDDRRPGRLRPPPAES